MALLKYSLRRLKQSPGFTATVVVTLALGIGATTGVFTLIQQVMLQSLPVAKAQQLWRIGDAVTCCYSTGYAQGNHAAQNDWTLFSWEAYQRFREDTPAFEDLAAFHVDEDTGLGARIACSNAGPARTARPNAVLLDCETRLNALRRASDSRSRADARERPESHSPTDVGCPPIKSRTARRA